MASKPEHSYEFGPFRIDVNERVLFRNNKPLPLTPKAFHLLKILVENHGHVVEKETLMAEIWSDSFVEEGNLAFNIRSLRKLLDDDARNPKFIETIPRRGYRFIAEIKHVDVNGHADRGLKSVPVESDAVLEDLSGPARRIETRRPGAVVALADWRSQPNPARTKKEEPYEPQPGNRNGRVATIGLAPAPPVVKHDRPTRFLILAAVVAAVVLAGLGYSIYRITLTENTAAFSMAKVSRLTSKGKTKFAAVSPDGKFAAYILDEGDRQSIRLKNIAGDSDVEVLPPEPTTLGSLTFSPDGDHLYYGANQKLYRLPVLGGTPKKVLDEYGGRQHNRISFSPEAKQFAFVRNARYEKAETPTIVLADTDGGDERALASGPHLGVALWSAAWSPDGKTIACAAENAEGKYGVIFVRASDGELLSSPAAKWKHVTQVIWQADGKSLLVIASQQNHIARIWELSYPAGDARRLTDDPHNYQSISLSANGRALVAARAEQESHIWLMPSDDTTQAKPLTDGFKKFDGVFSVGWQDNDTLVYEAIPDDKGEFWAIRLDRSSKKLADGVSHSALSPDGRHIVFSGDEADGGEGLYRLNVSDGEKIRLTAGRDIWATFSPDGRWIIFNRFADEAAVWRVSIDGGDAVKLTNCSCLPVSPVVSPDGRFIAFWRGKSASMSHPQVSIIPFEGGDIIKAFNMPLSSYEFLEGEAAVQWAPDGQAVSYVVHTDGISNVWRQSLTDGEPVRMTNFTSGLIFNFAYSPDGRQLALSRGTVSRDVILVHRGE